MKRMIILVALLVILAYSFASAQNTTVAGLQLPVGLDVQIFCQGNNVEFFSQKDGANGVVRCLITTPTVVPPTATIVPATSTPTSPATPTGTPTSPPTPVYSGAVPRTVNVPLIDAPSGSPLLDANNWTMIDGGSVFDTNFITLRLVSSNSGLHFRLQNFDDRFENGDKVAIYFANTFSTTAQFGGSDNWTVASRCGGDGNCRGWTGDMLLPWASGQPTFGTTMPFTLTATDFDGGVVKSIKDITGTLRFGTPNYYGQNVTGQVVLTTRLTADAPVGGGTTCGSDDDPLYFPTWGTRNTDDTTEMRPMGSWYQANIGQFQWDVADWPCYSRYFARFNIPTIPNNAQIVSATVTMYQFGNPGYGSGNAGDSTGTTVYEVVSTDSNWDEQNVAWDTAPKIFENTTRTSVPQLPMDCLPTGGWYCDPPIPYTFDVTKLVKESINGQVNFGLITSAGQYHSGKFFYTREASEDKAPLVKIAYVIPISATNTPSPTATNTPFPTATSTPALPTPTSVLPTPTPIASNGRTFYISTSGNDNSPGGLTTPWKTFAKAWSVLIPGDTLLVMDGVYNDSIQPNTRNGEPGKPITIRAMNDGNATIDGQGQRRPLQLGDTWGPNGGPIGNWFVVEGIVFKNGTDAVVHIKGSNNVLKRVSAYNANVDVNSTVFLLWGDNNLVEDSVAAGTGRYMFEVYQGSNNTMRRIFAQWEQWDGRQFCGVQWPHGYNIGVYNASGTTIENAIAYGRAPAVGILVQANDDNAVANNNAILGSMALLSGRDRNGQVWTYGSPTEQPTTRPLPSSCPDNVTQWSWGGQRVGFALTGQGTMTNNVFRDIVAKNNMGVGFVTSKPYGVGDVNTTLDHATLSGNAAGTEFWERSQGGNILIGTTGVQTITNSNIQNSSLPVGEGARLQNRYENRVLTNTPLLPWPMYGRILSELNVDVNQLIVSME